MRISRFYTNTPLYVDSEIEFNKQLAHYVSTVLRLKQGDPVVLFNGDGNEYSAEILVTNKKQTIALVNTQLSIRSESPLQIHLAQGVSKGDRMDFALQKSVELGVSEITPVITERCSVKLSEERWAKKHEQWQKIVISACEQSGRNVIPTLHEPINLSSWIGQSTEQAKIILSPSATTYLSSLKRNQHGFRLLIGPEGGLSEQEIYTCEQTGFQSANLGPRVLRTETAALASIAIIQAIFGDL
ncbi:16S rRNA (uracil(1498)-N(3))-methyltransferase [Glaciecola sp. MH2013]|uniref:16S rRNA (uracil(1498)-N(3))-methyltransferase n=1 Tax=Glaciecola sp. MH2013 TaxID=2785524 RepID=UPI00189ECED3|nr:16S rRNA (uracil(1498)-N(3))-methyltransferase [Glaciecola sp. MH2013]MBF7072004.1 16S rRNA (uracil(1498)-N(3))-methyltransferase [Glaciecola sp. MH2013]